MFERVSRHDLGWLKRFRRGLIWLVNDENLFVILHLIFPLTELLTVHFLQARFVVLRRFYIWWRRNKFNGLCVSSQSHMLFPIGHTVALQVGHMMPLLLCSSIFFSLNQDSFVWVPWLCPIFTIGVLMVTFVDEEEEPIPDVVIVGFWPKSFLAVALITFPSFLFIFTLYPVPTGKFFFH